MAEHHNISLFSEAIFVKHKKYEQKIPGEELQRTPWVLRFLLG